MHDFLIIENKKFLSTKLAAKIAGYTSDYVGQLYRLGKVEGKMVGRSLYVREDSLVSHKLTTSPTAIIKKVDSLTAPVSVPTMQVAPVASAQALTANAVMPVAPSLIVVPTAAATAATTTAAAVKSQSQPAGKGFVPKFKTRKVRYSNILDLALTQFVSMLLVGTITLSSLYIPGGEVVKDVVVNGGDQVAQIASNTGDAYALFARNIADTSHDVVASAGSFTGQTISTFKNTSGSELTTSAWESFKSWIPAPITRFAHNFGKSIARLFGSNTKLAVNSNSTIVNSTTTAVMASAQPTVAFNLELNKTSISEISPADQKVLGTNNNVTLHITPINIQGLSESIVDKKLADLRTSILTDLNGTISHTFDSIARMSFSGGGGGTTVVNNTTENPFDGTLASNALTIGGTATSTFAGGIAVSGGCVSVNGVCLGTGSSSYTDADVDAYINASTTIPKTYAANTFSNTNIFNGGATISTLTLNNALAAIYGGTGISSYAIGDILYADSGTTLTRLARGSDGTVLKILGGVPTWGTDLTTGGGGAAAWATTSDSLAVYTSNPSNVILIGTSATTTTGNILEVVGNTKLGGALLATGSTTLQNFTALNSTTTNATSTTFFATTASTSNLFATTGNIGTLTAGNLTTGSLSLLSALTVSNGGTGASAFGQGWIFSNGGTGALSASSSPTVNYITATSTTATSTFAGGLTVAGAAGLNVLQNGNVGVGVTNPGSNGKFEVAGNIYSNNYIIANASFRTATAGTAAFPSLQGGTSNNNGLFFTGSNVGFSTAGTERMRIDSTGNVGIGTSTPFGNLDVAGTRPLFSLSDTSAGLDQKHWFMSSQGGNLYVGTSSDAFATTTLLTIGNSGAVIIGTTTGQTQTQAQFIIRNDGKSNIFSMFGTNSTTNALSLSNGGTLQGTALSFATLGVGPTSSSVGITVIANSNNTADLARFSRTSSGNILSVIDKYGNLGIGTTTPYAQLSISATSTATTTFAIRPMSGQSANIFDLYDTSGNLQSVITAGGNWGIGSTSPFAKLSVVGDGYFTGNINAANITATGTLAVTGTGTSTFANGIALSGGCVTVNGTCIGGSGGASVTGGSAGMLTSWVDGTTLTATGTPTAASYYATSTTATSTFAGGLSVAGSAGLNVLQNGNVGIGKSNPGVALDVTGAITSTGSITTTAGNIVSANAVMAARNNGFQFTSSSVMLAATDGQISFYNSSLTDFTRLNFGGITSAFPSLGRSNANLIVQSADGTFATNLGIGTSTPYSKLSVWGAGTGTNRLFELTNSASTTLASVLENGTTYLKGNLGIGTTSPYAALSVVGASGVVADIFTATSTTATSTFAGGFSVGNGALQYDYSTGKTSIDNLSFGSLSFETNAGLVNWFDLPVDSTVAAGTVEGYAAQVGGKSLLTLYSEADGAGSVQNSRVSIGSTTIPYARLSVFGAGSTAATKTFELVNNASTTLMSVLDNGTTYLNGSVGVGTTSPFATFAVNPVAGQASNQFVVGSSTATNFVINNSGNVGIGTDPGIYKLNVTGNVNVTGNISSNNIITADRFSAGPGAVNNVSYKFAADSGTGLYMPITGALGISTNSLERVRIDSAGNFGIGTSTPYSKLSVWGAGTGTNRLFELTNSASTTLMSVLENGTTYLRGNIGIGTTTATYALTVAGNVASDFGASFTNANSAGWTNNLFYNSAGHLTYVGNGGPTVTGVAYTDRSYLEAFDTQGISLISDNGDIRFYTGGVASSSERARLTLAGNFGIGTSSPYAALAVVGEAVARNFTATSTTATSTIAGGLVVGGGALQYDLSTGITSIDNASLGSLSFDTNAGMVNWFDLPVDSTAPVGTMEGYTAQVGGKSLLTLYSESDGAGSIQNSRVSIGSSTVPYARLSVFGIGSTAATKTFELVNNASTTLASVLDNGTAFFLGNMGIGTTSPTQALTVVGTVQATSFNATSTTATSTFAGGLSVAGATGLNVLQNGLVGIGTAAPSKTLSVAGQIGVTDYIFTTGGFGGYRFGSSGSAGVFGNGFSSASDLTYLQTNNVARLYVDGIGNVGIGTSTPYSHLSVWGAGTGTNRLFELTNSASTTLASVLENGTAYFAGNVGIGTTSPYAALSVAGSTGVVANIFTATSTTATSTIAGGLVVGNGALQYDLSSGVTSIAGLETGALNFDTDAGAVNWVDMALSAAPSGTTQSYTANLNGNPMLTVYGLSTGSGNIGSLGVGIGTTTPSAKLSVWANGTGTGQAFEISDNASTTLARILDNGTAYFKGNIGVGTTSPVANIDVWGSSTSGLQVTNTTAPSSGSGGGVSVYTSTIPTATDQRLGFLTFGSRSSPNSFNPAAIQAFSSQAWSGSANGSYLTFSTNPDNTTTRTEVLRLTSAGNVGIASTSPFATFAVNPIAGQASNQFVVGSSTATAFVINNSGQVAIGSSDPGTNMLKVSGGTVQFTSGLTLGGSLTTNGVYGGVNSGNTLTLQASSNNPQTGYVLIAPTTGLSAVGTSTPYSKLSVWGLGTGTRRTFDLVNSASTTLFSMLDNGTAYFSGNVGIGTTSPYAALSIVGASGVVADIYTATSTTATSTFAGGLVVGGGALQYDLSTGKTSIDNLSLGSFSFDTNAGMVNWADLPVTSAATAGTVEGYTAQINGNQLLTLYGESDGAGGIKNIGVGIGTSSPYAALSVVGSTGVVADHYAATSTTATSTFPYLNITGTNGTSTVTSNFYVQGTLRSAISYVGDLVFSNGFRFVEGSTTPDTLNIQNNNGQSIFTIDDSGNIGLGTSTPAYKLQAIGDIAATGFVNTSTREAKQDITYLTDGAKISILDKIRNVKIAQYHYKTEDASDPLRLGLIAEEAPSEVLSVSGKGVDIYKLSTFILAGVQELQNKVDTIDARVTTLESMLGTASSSPFASLSVATSTATTTVASAGITSFFSAIGIAFDDMTATFKNIVANTISAKKVTVEEGITIKDKATGAYYCIVVENGVMKNVAGECGAVSGAATSTPATGGSATGGATPTPVVSATPAPVVTGGGSATPTASPTPAVSVAPSATPTPSATVAPSATPTPAVTATPAPTVEVTPAPTVAPTTAPAPVVSDAPAPAPVAAEGGTVTP